MSDHDFDWRDTRTAGISSKKERGVRYVITHLAYTDEEVYHVNVETTEIVAYNPVYSINITVKCSLAEAKYKAEELAETIRKEVL